MKCVWHAAVSPCSDDDFDMSRYSSSGYSSAEVRCLRDQVSIRTHSTVCQHRVVTLQPDHPPPLSPLLTPHARYPHASHSSKPALTAPRDQNLHPRSFLSPLAFISSPPQTRTSPLPPLLHHLHHCWPSVVIVCPPRTLTDGLILTTSSQFRSFIVGLQTDGSDAKNLKQELPLLDGIHWERELRPQEAI